MRSEAEIRAALETAESKRRVLMEAGWVVATNITRARIEVLKWVLGEEES